MTWLHLISLLALSVWDSASLSLPDSERLRQLLSRYQEGADLNGTNTAGGRARRAILWSDREEILQLHNKLRGSVYPTAADMEHMVWDDELERSATHWAEQCHWDHGPADLLMSIGQNLAVHMGRHRSPAYHVQAWYDEVKDYTYPYPSECNPWCPERCSGPMCTHYTQLVWATTNRVGCAVHVCPAMDVWGDVWENAVYLVCNYSPKGNWIGVAPYQHGRPCSQCPPSYGGGCRNNLCYKDSQRSETEDMNEVEKPQVPLPPRTTARPRPKPSAPKRPAPKAAPRASKTPSSTFLVQNVKCETRLRDKCKGTTCNRYNCPANCLNKKGNVWGTIYYDVQSSICRAAIHSGAIDNSGGTVDVTRVDKSPFFVKATKNGVESSSKYKPGNAFVVQRTEEVTADCYTTVAEICPFKKPYSHCPRVLCPSDCKSQPSYWSPVIGNSVYADGSSICKAAIHAGVMSADGGLVDVLPLDKRKSYVGVLKNGIQSESKSTTEGASFRVFPVRK
ncbi:cysteine-rich secretory protein LCCL domain-containing 2 [Betta splendens]|uniref:Cysteine-rich secretory protein LCCL domain-containing 2 n=1 Tax=Betta splendens TaxID=158456 RepID=A0A6P7M466_BETSP|nr:cysteine-rich secretory protein LCCL domain-containing 2 [Betta splendens]XP_055363355.1 cysteine-rich secretory protein LCCL domain-containing 2 [Betta splendens]